jgi:thioredoxin-like negative regulator of GroEL
MSSTVYMFSSPTCAPCKYIKPVINELKEDYSHLKWVDVDITSDPDGFSRKFGVTMVPTMVIANETDKIGSFTGTQAMGYLTLLKKTK